MLYYNVVYTGNFWKVCLMRYIISFCLASILTLPALITPASAEVPRVVTDVPPIGSLVAQVMGDLGAPVVLLDKGADAHAFQLRPSQAADLAAAQAIIWIGPEMTPWLDRAAGINTGAVDLRLLSVPGTLVQPFAEGHEDDDAAAHNHAAAAHDHAAEAHDHGDLDPHAWLDPANAGLWLGEIARTFSDLDPDNAATYAANARAAQADLLQLDADLKVQLAPAQGHPLVVFHNAYGYFAGHYGLNVVGAVSDGDAANPGAAHLRALQATMAEAPVCLFPEVNHDPKLLAVLADATGVRVGAALDPEGSALPNGPALYADLMRALAAAIAGCVAG